MTESEKRKRMKEDFKTVIRGCKDDSSCPFTNFDASEGSLSFEYHGKNGNFYYKFISDTDHYPYNSVLSSALGAAGPFESKLCHEVMPTVFAELAKDLYKEMTFPSTDNNNLLHKPEVDRLTSVESHHTDLSDSWSDQDDYDDYNEGEDIVEEEYAMHSMLSQDMDLVRRDYGDSALGHRWFPNIDSIDVELYMDMKLLDAEIANAWKILRIEPLIIRLGISVSSYLDGPEPKVEVFQPSKKENFGVGSQMKKIMQNFLHDNWKMANNETVKAAVGSSGRPASPPKKKIHTRNPGPVPAAVGDEPPANSADEVLPSVDAEAVRQIMEMGFSQQLAQNALVIGRGCVEDAVNLLVLSPDACADVGYCSEPMSGADPSSHPPPKLPPRRVAGQAATTAAKKPKGKLPALPPQSSEVDPPPADAQSRSIMSQMCRAIKDTIFPDFAPQVFPSTTASGRTAKQVPGLEQGFLVQVLRYAYQRLCTLNEFCVICDELHVFQNGSMLKPTVCPRELCVFAFQTLGVMSDAAEDIATGADVVDILIAMARAACQAQRRETIFEPYPTIVDPHHPTSLVLHPNNKDYDRVSKAMDAFKCTKDMALLVGAKLKKELDSRDPLAYPLLGWIISSNRSHIVRLPSDRQLSFMRTPYQFLLLSSPPAKEALFRAEKEKYGSIFAFHGSHIENWHSILRQGLLNASGTKYQRHGAAYGNGIYLSPQAQVSFNYSGMGHGVSVLPTTTFRPPPRKNTSGQLPKVRPPPPASSSMRDGRFLKSNNLTCIALCEVINSTDLKKHSNIWVESNPDHVCTRFFFMYEDGQVGESDVDTQKENYARDILKAVSYQMR